jgi:flagellar motor switch protein FliN/FliY
MKEAASRIVAQAYLKGYFGTVDEMLSCTSSVGVPGVADLSPDDWSDYISRYSVGMQARAKGGGAIVMLLSAADVNNIAAVFRKQEPESKAALDPDALPSLKEVFEPCLGGGASYFKETFGNEIELEECDLAPFGSDQAEPLIQLLGDDVTKAPFTFTVPGAAQGSGVLLFSQNLEATVPDEALAEAVGQEGATGSGGAQLSQNELDDILTGVGAPKPTQAAPSDQPPDAGTPVPSNIDMVLDIRLVATARLGRVEMPIADILSLGPGSIIEVGHLVDEPIELLVNDKLIARGDVVVVEEKFGLRITEIISPQARIESLR